MQKPVIFVAAEAGAAAWMAPVWQALGLPVTLALSDVARDHLLNRYALSVDHMSFPDEEIDLSAAAALVVSATGRAGEAEIVARAERQGVASLQVIDYWSNYGRRFVGVMPDFIAAIDDRAVGEAMAEGLQQDRLQVIGHPGWEVAAVLPPASRRSVAFIGQPLRRIYGASLGYDEFSAWRMLVDMQAQHPDLIGDLVYLLHPEETEGPVGAAVTRDSAGTLARCGTMIGASSSLMVDALLGGRHVISLQPNAIGADGCALSRHGRIARATDGEALLKALSAAAVARDDFGRVVAGSTARACALIQAMVRA